jgi:hypothetical protein
MRATMASFYISVSLAATGHVFHTRVQTIIAVNLKTEADQAPNLLDQLLEQKQ